MTQFYTKQRALSLAAYKKGLEKTGEPIKHTDKDGEVTIFTGRFFDKSDTVDVGGTLDVIDCDPQVRACEADLKNIERWRDRNHKDTGCGSRMSVRGIEYNVSDFRCRDGRIRVNLELPDCEEKEDLRFCSDIRVNDCVMSEDEFEVC